MAPQKMSCKNDAKYMYTGKEMSPMGLGYCADAEMVGKKMAGRDGKDWIVGTKNGVKIWQRAPDAPLVREEPVMQVKAEPTLVSDSESEKDDVSDVESEKTPKNKPIEVKPQPSTPKKRGRPAAKKEEVKPNDKEVKADDKEAKPKRKYVRKQKTTDEAKPEDVDIKVKADDKEAKPKRKYVRKPKAAEENADEPEKKVRKPRAKTEYNTFISEKLKELREKQKELKTTEYFKMAIAEWKIYKESKKTVMEALKEEEVTA